MVRTMPVAHSLLIESDEMPAELAKYSQRYATAYHRGLAPALRRSVSVEDVVEDAYLAVWAAWALAGNGRPPNEFWRDDARASVAARLEELHGRIGAAGGIDGAQPEVTRLADLDWRDLVCRGTERFMAPAARAVTSTFLDEEFVDEFFEAASKQLGHVSALHGRSPSIECGCADGEHDSVVQMARRWHQGRRSVDSKLLELQRFCDQPGVTAEQIQGLAELRLGSSGSLSDCCAAMWFGLLRFREEDRIRRVMKQPMEKRRRSTPRSDLVGGSTLVAPDNTTVFEWIMTAAHLLLANESVGELGALFVTFSAKKGRVTVVRPTRPTRVLVPQVLREIFLTMTRGEYERTFYKFALVAARRILSDQNLSRGDAGRDALDKQVTRVALNSTFVLWQYARHHPDLVDKTITNELWQQVRGVARIEPSAILKACADMGQLDPTPAEML